jgi:steroid delta-isomerase-like uncharacterized protein
MSAENKALVRRMYDEVVNKKNIEALDALCAAEFVDHNPTPGSGGRLAEVKAMFRDMLGAFPDLTMTVQDQIAEGDKVACRIVARGTHKGDYQGIPATGKSVEIEGIDIVRIAGGKAVERWGHFDDVKMLEQLGVMQR